MSNKVEPKQVTVTTTVKLTPSQLSKIIKEYLGLPEDTKVEFKTREESDYMDRYPRQVFSEAEVTYAQNMGDIRKLNANKDVCPKCNSTKLEVERSPNGSTRCTVCGFSAKNSSWPNPS